MNILQNIKLLIQSLIDTTLFAVTELVNHIQSSPVSFILTASLAVFAYLLLNLYKVKVSKRAINRKMETVIYILSPFIFIMFTYYSVSSNPSNPLYILLNYLGFYWLASAIMKAPAKYLEVDIKRHYAPAMFFILLALGLALYVDVTLVYSTVSKELAALFEFVRGTSKVFFIIGFFIYIRKVLPAALRAIRQSYPKLSFIAGSVKLVTFAYLFLSVLWVFNLVSLNFSFVISVALLGMMLTMLSFAFHKVERVVDGMYSRESYTELEWSNLKKHSSKLVFVILCYIYYAIIYNSLGLGSTLDRLKIVYLFETKLFSLSLYGLISAILIFIFLKSFLYLFTKYIRVIFFEGELTEDADSVEIIFYNLGLLIVFTITFLQIGITWQVVLPIAGALGIGLGFGLQTVINNYICGFILLFSKKVRIGDFVELPGGAGRFIGVESETVFGKVVSIDMFATTVKTYDNIEIMVPNSVFISETIINYTRSDRYVRVRIPVGVSYSSDIDVVQKLIYEAIDECEYVVKHKKTDVWFMEYGDSSLNFMALFWLNMHDGLQTASVRNVFLHSLWHKFKEHDIEIPFPQQDVWFRNDLNIANKEKLDEI